MHALILGVFKQRANPAIVIDHAAQTVKMGDRRTDHAGIRCYRF
jgi:hypothetical protein